MRQRLRWLSAIPALFLLTPVSSTASTTNSAFAGAMQQAALGRGVPLPVVEATAYVNTRWEWINTPQMDGGVGPMKVQPSQMALATSLSGHSQAEITGDLFSNLDAGAALMAHLHTGGTDLASWQSAVAASQGPVVANQIFNVIRAGASRTTSTGEVITLAPQTVSSPNGSGGASSINGPAATTGPASTTATSPDYPPASWVPADPSNFTVASRTHDYPIDMIVIHDIEGDAGTAVQLFQTPNYEASAHYVVGYDGSITQMVLEKDIAWHAGNWDYNTRAIGIEHAGFASQNLYTTREYDASAHLAASICSRYGVPMDRTHVIGHYEVPDPNNPGLYGGEDHHTDPGPYWDWTTYMSWASLYTQSLPSPPHMMTQPRITPINGGAIIGLDGRTCRLPIAGYQVVVNPGNIVVNLPGSATSTTITGLRNGATYTVTVTATNADGQDTNSATFIPSPPCTTPTLTATPPSPGPTGGTVTFTAGTTACTNPNYRFWIMQPDGSWAVVRGFQSSNTYAWTATSGAGTYRAEVDVKQQTSSVAYDAYSSIYYTLSGCTLAGLTTDRASPAPQGATVVLQGLSTCPGAPEYRFWVGQNGLWKIVQDYSATSTYSWNTASLAAGTYGLEVDVRNQGSTVAYDKVANLYYTLVPCTGAGLITNKASPQSPGSVILLTGSASCPGPAQYRFWVGVNGIWTIVQDFSASSTFSWDTTGKAQGTYGLEVDVRNQGSTVAYDKVANLYFTLASVPCSTPAFSASPAYQAGTGARVTLTASTDGCAHPTYRFWISPPGQYWSIVQDYSASNTFTWTTTGAAGTYRLEVDVRDASSSVAYDRVTNISYTLVPCSGAYLSTDKASPQKAGTQIVLTGSAACPGAPEYRFWVGQNGIWKIVQDFSPSNTFTWNTTGLAPGTYGLEVDVRDQGATAPYEKVYNLYFAIT